MLAKGGIMPRSQRQTAARRASGPARVVQRVQTGVRIEKHILKVLKAIAEYHEITLGDVIEGIVLHAFEGRPPFRREGLERIREFRRIYGLELSAVHAHHMIEAPAHPPARSTPRRRS
jgi:predicted DNA-binding ribbon-helix-helix protein